MCPRCGCGCGHGLMLWLCFALFGFVLFYLHRTGAESEARWTEFRLQHQLERAENEVAKEAELRSKLEEEFASRLKKVGLEKVGPFVEGLSARVPLKCC